MSQEVYAILGPTASGKTDLAIELVEKHGFDIISVDSAMIYRGLDIGSAKPTLDELARAPHRLIDICEPNEIYSAADFCQDALLEIEQIINSGKKPLLVGGSMMYFHALVNGIADLPDRDDEIRLRLQREVEAKGLDTLHQRLAEIDPVAASSIKAADPQRIIRAIEVFEISGQPISKLQAKTESKLPYPIRAIGLMNPNKEWLNERIAMRFDMMLAAGFLEEVKSLKAFPELNLDMPSMRCVGYRQAWQYLDGEFDLSEMRERAIIATRQLAKRQRTWLRKFDWVEQVDSPEVVLSRWV